MYVIYALIDPRDNTVRYVGITEDVYKRFLDHLSGSSGNFAKNAWLFELRAANKMVIMETLEEVEGRQQALERETYWIKHFEMLKEPITNISQRSSPRKAKRTNLQFGRKIVLDLMQETAGKNHCAQEVASPVQAESPSTESSTQVRIPPVSQETLDHIRRMKARGFSDREIASLVGLSGRKYALYRECVAYLAQVKEA
jgi:predicted GIY-YIG superfamily endonuclease